MPALKKLMGTIIKSDTGCWNWVGGRDKKGNGYCFCDGKRYSTKNLFLEAFNKPTGGFVYLCNNKQCLNPDHILIDQSRTRSRTLKDTEPVSKDTRPVSIKTETVRTCVDPKRKKEWAAWANYSKAPKGRPKKKVIE